MIISERKTRRVCQYCEMTLIVIDSLVMCECSYRLVVNDMHLLDNGVYVHTADTPAILHSLDGMFVEINPVSL
jgi:hypothetical protein